MMKAGAGIVGVRSGWRLAGDGSPYLDEQPAAPAGAIGRKLLRRAEACRFVTVLLFGL